MNNPGFFYRVKKWCARRTFEIAIFCLLILVLILVALPHMVVNIQAGEQGVLWRRLFNGTVLDRTYDEGATLIFPWDKMEIYDLRLQRVTGSYDALSSNGLNVTVDVSIRFRPYISELTKLHKYVGPDYTEVILLPDMGSHVRSVVALYTPEDLYSANREEIQNKILLSIRKHTGVTTHNVTGHNDISEFREYFFVDNILVRSVTLPEVVSKAIEQKEAAKQQALAYDHRIEAAEKEKLRKRIEAEGIRDFQQAISAGISEKYLKWKGINATLELAKSNNTKVVVIGSSPDGLPLILGGDYTASTTPNQPPPEPEKDKIAEEDNETGTESEAGAESTFATE